MPTLIQLRPRDEESDLDANPPLPSAPAGPNLMRISLIARILRSRWYPGILQVPVAAVFGLVAFQLLAGPAAAQRNAGTALMWVLWWPILPITFVLVGRLWCAVCPFGAISDVVQKLVGVNRPVPRFLKLYGLWIIDAQFLAITWSDHVWGIVESPWGSGVLLLLLTTGVIISGALFQRRTFCRYLCFLGGLCSNYSRGSVVELRADQDICRTCKAKAACFNGTATQPGCPLFNFPRTMDSSANCTLCANCIKACPNDAIQVRARKPLSELWFLDKPKIEESFLAMAIMGIVLIQNLTMLSIWQDILGWIEKTTGITSYPLIFTVAFVVAVSVPVGLMALASKVASRGNLENTVTNFARFGYALIPLDIAAHLAHNLFHLLAEGGVVFSTVASLFGFDSAQMPTALASSSTILILQLIILALGVAGSAYTIRRITNRRYGSVARRRATTTPYLVLLGVLTVMNVYLFLMPMAHRM
ncbi:MAG: 4Fe-4S binding protein [Propionibacteriaceae bacterium]|uniref:4Fe-4S binding protein n=1 Tax=Propionicimonas sp. T2.31MG-18 TaxID=3157620 RepID=UPI001D566699|nr:4Fe-4S binding protein [Actinomycetota bacterium]MCB0911352.1 4Fe-4S binding protein [Propionibacteriaceae bacterium]